MWCKGIVCTTIGVVCMCVVPPWCAFFFLLSNVPSDVLSIVLYIVLNCDSDPSLYREGGRKL